MGSRKLVRVTARVRVCEGEGKGKDEGKGEGVRVRGRVRVRVRVWVWFTACGDPSLSRRRGATASVDQRWMRYACGPLSPNLVGQALSLSLNLLLIPTQTLFQSNPT